MGGRGSSGKSGGRTGGGSGSGGKSLEFKKSGKYLSLENGDEIKDVSAATTSGYNVKQLPKSLGNTLHITKDFDVTSYVGNKYTITKEINVISGHFTEKTIKVKQKGKTKKKK